MLNERGAIYTRDLPDGRVLDVVPLALGRARITLSPNREAGWWTDGW